MFCFLFLINKLNYSPNQLSQFLQCDWSSILNALTIQDHLVVSFGLSLFL